MRALQWVFHALTAIGYSRPSCWTSPLKKVLYKVYTACVFLTLHALVVAEILDLVLVAEDRNDYSENLYTTMVMIVTCFKMAGLLTMRKNIEILINILNEEPFRPANAREEEIRSRFDKVAT